MGFLTCKYRKNKDGEIESEMFDSDNIPDGWEDSPACFDNKKEPVDVSDDMPSEPSMDFVKKKRRKRGD